MSTTLCQCAELEDYAEVHGSWAYGTGTGYFRAGYARAYLYSVNTVPSPYLLSETFTAQTTLCASIRYACQFENAWRNDAGHFIFGFCSGGGFKLGLMTTQTSTAGEGYIKLVKYDGSTITTLATSTEQPGDGFTRFDVYVENYGASARVRVWVTLGSETVPQLWIDYSGDVTVTGVTDLDQLYVNVPRFASNNVGLSEVFACDVPTTRMCLVTLAPNAAGDASSPAFDSADYTYIDELTADVADFCESGTAGQKYLVNVSGLPAGVTLVPLSVQVTALAAKGEAGPTKLDIEIKSNSAEAFSSDQTLDVAYAGYRWLMQTNPANSDAAWTAADIAALQIGGKSVT